MLSWRRRQIPDPNDPQREPIREFNPSTVEAIFTEAYESKEGAALTKEDKEEKKELQTQALNSVRQWQFQPLAHAIPEPAFQVWAKIKTFDSPLDFFSVGSCSEVSIVFGSTKGVRQGGIRDWVSNGREAPWVGPAIRFAEKHGIYNTDYTLLKRNIDTIIGDIIGLHCYNRTGSTIVSVGASLGGGLAQFAAYANANDPARPRIEKVFAFNSSPEKAVDLVKEEYKKNRKGLEIDGINEAKDPLNAGKNAHEEAGFERPAGFGPEDVKHCKPLIRHVEVAQATATGEFFQLHGTARLAASLLASDDPPKLPSYLP
jgi:hypothetical protein